MARIPGIKSNILDGNLNPVAPPINLDQSVLCIGTALDGPMYEPVAITSPENAEKLFGQEGDATLVKAIKAIWDSSEGTPNIRAVRIGVGKAAYLNLAEQAGSGTGAPTTGKTALKLSGRYPGSKYNIVSIRLNDSLNIEITYPDPGNAGTVISSVFEYDLDATDDSDKIKNVMDLANAINADTKLSRVIDAEVVPMDASFEIKIKAGDDGVTSASPVILNLSTILTNGSTVQDRSVLTGETPTPSPIATAGNRLYRLNKVYCISNSDVEELEIAGKASVETKLPLIDAKNNTNFRSVNTIKDWDSTGDYWVGPSGVGTISEFFQIVDGQVFQGISNGVVNPATQTYDFTTYLPPDNSGSIDTYGNQLGVTYGAATNYTQTGSAFRTYSIPETSLKRAEAKRVSLEYSLDAGSSWVELPWADASGNTIWNVQSFSGPPSPTSTATMWVASGSIQPGIAGFPVGTRLRISYDSIIGQMWEQLTLTAVQSTESFTNYFVRGDELVLGDVAPTNLGLRYGTYVEYESGTNLSLDDSKDGVVRFTDPELQPGPGGLALSPSGSLIGFQYEYLPEWVTLDKSAQSLNGGTNGDKLTNNQLYTELAKAYENTKNYSVDIILPLGAYVDSTKYTYHPTTGKKLVSNAGFHTQLSAHLASLEKDVNETIGMMSVLPPASTSQSDVTAWVEKCTVVNLGDPTRAANIMASLGDKNISVLAFYPFGEASAVAQYAGYVASLPSYTSPTNKSIANLYPAFNLARSQNEAMIGMRYVTMKSNRNITEAITAAPAGSDFELLTTVRITYAAMDVVREVGDPFLGKPNNLQNLNAMDAAIQKGLQAMVDAGALRRYDFAIKSDPDEQVLGIVNIELTLVPVFEIRFINVTVRLRSS